MEEQTSSSNDIFESTTEAIAQGASQGSDNIGLYITIGMIVIGVVFTSWIVLDYYKKFKSKQLLNYVPVIWTSLGILGTFMTIVLRLKGGVGDLSDVNILVKNLAPAFWTSIIGISGALISSIIIKSIYARDEKDEITELSKISGVRYCANGISLSPELALLKIEQHMVQSNNYLKILCAEINKAREEQSETIERNLKQLESLYDRVFEENKKHAEQLTNQYLTGINKLVSETNDQLKESTTNILTGHTALIRELFDRELTQLDELSVKIRSIIDEIPNEFETTRSDLLEIIQKTIVDKYQFLIEANSALTNELLDRVRQYESNIHRQSTSEFSSMIAELSNQIVLDLSSLETSLHNQEMAFRNAAKEIESSIVSSNKSLSQSATNYSTLVTELNTLLGHLSSYTSQTEQLLSQENNTSKQMTDLIGIVEQIVTKNQQLRYELTQWKRVHKKVVINEMNGTKTCPNCGGENPIDANFCRKCASGFWNCETFGSQLSKAK